MFKITTTDQGSYGLTETEVPSRGLHRSASFLFRVLTGVPWELGEECVTPTTQASGTS